MVSVDTKTSTDIKMKRFVDYKNDCNRVRDSKERQKKKKQQEQQTITTIE